MPPQKISTKALNIIKHTLASHPRTTARSLKESNPEEFGETSVCTVSRCVLKLSYTCPAPRKVSIKGTKRLQDCLLHKVPSME